MQFSESWLRSLVQISQSSEALSHLLTMAGLEVEEMCPVAPVFDKVVVAKILTKEKHPDADRLNVLTVDVGQAEPLTIVCGAQNVSVGMKSPCALVGAKLPGIEIKQAKVRGVASYGMMCSAKELGLAEESSGLLELDESATTGQSIRELLDLDDNLITLKLTPNRSDCLSLQGIAREVAALTGARIKAPEIASFARNAESIAKIKVSATEACPRYVACQVSGVNAKAVTPEWMKRRLERCGLRSISAIVDVTNYVLLEMGQPLHAFDSSKLQGDLEVRYARKQEKLLLLNEKEVDLQEDMLVITDANGPVALAGIMGGELSSVDETTTDIILESAFFNPKVITGKSRRLGFSSDSSFRFERGVDFENTAKALERATGLILQICGGTAGVVTEIKGAMPERKPVRLRYERIRRVLGISLENDEVISILHRLGMQVKNSGDELLVTPPSYRFDIAIEEDLIEEIARVHGYEQIPQLSAQAVMEILPDVEIQKPISLLKQAMVQRDYQEIITYSFVEDAWEKDLCGNANPVKLKNPIASQLSVMRSSLIGGLISVLQTNLARKQPRVRLFEIGGCFTENSSIFSQQQRLGAIIYGASAPEQWGMAVRNVDFYDAKGDLESIFYPRKLEFAAEEHPASHPGRSARILLDNKSIGWIGELHPQWQQKYDLALPAIWFEVDFDSVMQTEMPTVSEISRQPLVRRDVAVLVDENVQVQTLLHNMKAENAPNVVEIALFDVYRGKGVEKSKKSLAFRVLLQDTQKTLTEEQIEQSMQRLVVVLQQNGAQLRV